MSRITIPIPDEDIKTIMYMGPAVPQLHLLILILGRCDYFIPDSSMSILDNGHIHYTIYYVKYSQR
ncbi:MAG: hypothetical protein GX974_03700 [Clostridiales bacterium]|nr:hypothetical protein [Clostridiales bacterium]